MKRTCAFVLLLLAASCAISPAGETEEELLPDLNRIERKAEEALSYCRAHNMDTTYYILVDMRIHSGKYRLLNYDLQKDSVISANLVSHGCGKQGWGKDHSRTHPEFSNEENSHCTSLGKYKIGERGVSQWGIGIKYLLHGLEPDNNKALRRVIVLHSWETVADEEVYPDGTPEGWGCPAVSNAAMQEIDALLSAKKRPVLLWIFY